MRHRSTRLSKAVLVISLACLLVSLGLSGCMPTAKPLVWQDQETSFADYATFEIRPVFNASGQVVDPAIVTTLTARLNEQFPAKGLSVQGATDAQGGVLVVQSELVNFEARKPFDSYGRTQLAGQAEATCTLRSRLLDKASDKVVAVIVATEVVSTGGAQFVPHGPGVITDAQNYLLQKTAAAIAREVARLMANRQSSPAPLLIPAAISPRAA